MTKKISKRNLIIIIAVSVVAILAIILGLIFGLPRPVFADGPNKDDAVVGNGTMAVQKGEYLYFVNGYVPAEDNFNGNKGSEIYQGAIYRIKASNSSFSVSNGILSFNTGELTTNEQTGSLVGAERLVSKIAGFENSKLYIFDDYLYFTSPSTYKALDTGATQTSFIDVYRIHLNGTKLKKLYTIKDFNGGDVEFYRNGENVYGVFYDGVSNLVIYKNTNQILKKSGVKSLVMPSFSKDYAGLDNRSEQTLVYLKDGKIGAIRLPQGNNTEIYEKEISLQNSRTLIAIENNTLFYSEADGVYCLDVAGDGIEKIIGTDTKNTRRLRSTTSYTSYLPIRTNAGAMLACVSGTTCVIVRDNNEANCKYLTLESGATLLFADKTNLIYKTDSNLYVIKYGVEAPVSEQITVSTVKFYNIPASFDGTFVYYFAEQTNSAGTSIYLERVNITSKIENEDGELEFKKQEISNRLEEDYLDPIEETEE